MDHLRTALATAFLLCLVSFGGCAGLSGPLPGHTSGGPPASGVTTVPVITPDPEDTVRVRDLTREVSITPCIPSWVCSRRSECSKEGLMSRTCADEHACNMTGTQPPVEDRCTYVPRLPSPGPYVTRISGDTICRQTAESAVNILRYRASPDYEYFRKYVGTVNCTYTDMCYRTGFAPGETRFYTVCIDSLEDPPTVYVDEPFWRSDPVWLAGVLVHEACHSEGYREYILKEGAEYDLTEFAGWKFERRCCDRMRSTWNQLGAPAYTDSLYRGCSL